MDAGSLRGLVANLQDDAERYRAIANNACDVWFAVRTEYAADGSSTARPVVELDPSEYIQNNYGGGKTALDVEADRLRRLTPRETTK